MTIEKGELVTTPYGKATKKDLKRYRNDLFVVIYLIVIIIALYALIETRPNHHDGDPEKKCAKLTK